MHRVVAGIVGALLLPTFVFALTSAEIQAQIDVLLQQIAALQAQHAAIIATSTSPPSCTQIARTLQRGMSGSDVVSLQKILISAGFLQSEATGYFGALTEVALQKWQAREGIISSGSPSATGWGIAGPRTRAALSARCAAAIPVPTPPIVPEKPVCSSPPRSPIDECVGAWEKLHDSNSCHIGWKCRLASVSTSGNKQPLINSIDGSMTLYVNQKGSWNVNASDPENGSLEYSVIWGDEGADSILSLLAGYSNPIFSSSALLTHAYYSIGRFSPEITVRDGAGNLTTSTFSVEISARPSSSTPITIPTAPAPGSCVYQGKYYSAGTKTEGYTISDLCLATGNICQSRTAYIPTYECKLGEWQESAQNPYPTLQSYGNLVGSTCSSHGATREVYVAPNTQLCRDLFCATTQNYAKISLSCAYTNWVDWGLFRAGATTTTICAAHQPCEYWYGDQGKACAPKQNGVCPVPSTTHPLGT